MEKKAVWIVVFFLLFAQAPVEAAKPRERDSHNPAPSNGPQNDPGYLAVKAALEHPAKNESGPSLTEMVSKAGAEIALSLKEAAGRSGDVRRVPQRGDPKTTFSQSENRYHSARQLPPAPDPVPDPAPLPDPTPDPAAEPTPDPVPVPDPVPAPEPEPVLDLTQWSVANSYQSDAYKLSVYFKAAGDGLYDVVLVVYDTVTGEALQATGYRTDTVYEMPDMDGFSLVTTLRREDGSWTDKYALLGAGTTWQDVTTWIELEFEPSGAFVSATIKTVEPILLETLALPSLDSIILQ